MLAGHIDPGVRAYGPYERVKGEAVLPDLGGGVSPAGRKHRNCRPRSSQNPFQPKGAETTLASFLIKLLLRNYLLRAKPDNRQILGRTGHLVDSWGWSQGTGGMGDQQGGSTSRDNASVRRFK